MGSMSYLADCVVPLDDVQREALHEFWDRVIADELGPMVETSRSAPMSYLTAGTARRVGICR